MKYFLIFVVLASASLFAAEPSHSQQVRPGATYRPQVGKLHIDFLLPQIEDRSPLSLSSFRGKKVLLLHFASW